MLFNSIQFLVFFVLVTTLYFRLSWFWRWRMLLAASCIFYMSFVPVYILILLVTILIDYAMAIQIEGAQGHLRKTYLLVSILATCAVLFVFKYYNFFAGTTNAVAMALGGQPLVGLVHIILPIGLSFHTFQSLSYVIEVYRGEQKAERDFGIYSLYVMYYPQLVAGPIERPQNLLHQFREDHRFNTDDLIAGLRLIAWGFFKKMVVADRAAAYVDIVYGDWRNQTGLSLLVATALFTIQIYADFSGYSSIAIGCSRVMGIRLMRNFNHPYFAANISDFWRRWHVSLSGWFRDYVYIPLGGSRVPRLRLYFNLMVTFVVSGIWHGANWTFAAWGAYNGLLLVLEHLAANLLPKRALPTGIVRWLLTLVLVAAGWVFFRAPGIGAAFEIFHKMAVGTHLSLSSLQHSVLILTGDNTALACMLTLALLIGAMFVVELFSERDLRGWTTRLEASRPLQIFAIVACFQSIFLFGVLRPSSFIYFQF